MRPLSHDKFTFNSHSAVINIDFSLTQVPGVCPIGSIRAIISGGENLLKIFQLDLNQGWVGNESLKCNMPFIGYQLY